MSCCLDSYNGLPCCCHLGFPTTTTTTCPFQICCDPSCDDGVICPELYSTDCVKYTGIDIPCYNIFNGASYTQILEGIISNLPICLPSTTTTTTTSTTTSTTSTTSTSTTSTSTTTTTTTSGPIPVFVDSIYTELENGNLPQSGVECWYSISSTQDLTQPEPPGLTWTQLGSPINMSLACPNNYYYFTGSIYLNAGEYLYIQIRTSGGTNIYYTNYDFIDGCSPVNPSFGAYTQCFQINTNIGYIDIPIKFPLQTVPKP